MFKNAPKSSTFQEVPVKVIPQHILVSWFDCESQTTTPELNYFLIYSTGYVINIQL